MGRPKSRIRQELEEMIPTELTSVELAAHFGVSPKKMHEYIRNAGLMVGVDYQPIRRRES